VREKVSSLWRGAVVGAAAGVFVLAAVVTALHALALLLADLLGANAWVGYAVVTALLLIAAACAGWLAWRLVRRGTPPTPQLAIEEARVTRERLSASAADSEGI